MTQLEGFAERAAKKGKKCVKGFSCGNSCQAKGKVCRKNLTPKQQKRFKELEAKVKKNPDKLMPYNEHKQYAKLRLKARTPKRDDDDILTREYPLAKPVVDSNSNQENPIVRFSTSDRVLNNGYFEILSHQPGAINLERVERNAVKVLLYHDPKQIVGTVERVWIDRGCGYCEFAWGTSPLAQQTRQDYNNGIIDKVSPGYRPDGEPELRDDSTVFLPRWELLELSLVAVPVDPRATKIRSLSLNTMTTVTIEDIRSQERDRQRQITLMADRFSLPSEMTDKLVEEGRSLIECKADIADWLNAQDGNPQPISRPGESLGFSEKEQKAYSIVGVLNFLKASRQGEASQTQKEKLGFEFECSRAIAAACGREPGKNGIYVPTRDLRIPLTQTRAAYGIGSAGIGGASVQTNVLGEYFIDFLKNRAMVLQMGATMFTGLKGIQSIPRKNAIASTYWVGENPGADITESEFTLDSITLTPKTIAGLSISGHQFKMQSELDAEALIRMEIAQNIAIGIDQAALTGTLSATVPQGIIGYSGVGSVALGTNGAAPTVMSIINLETLVATANADIGTLGYLCNAKTRGKLKNTYIDSPGTGIPIFGTYPDPNMPSLFGMVNGYRTGVTNALPSNLVKGSSGAVCSAMVFGNWADVLMGEWGVLELVVDTYSLLARLQTRYVGYQVVDINLRHPESFATITDMLTT
jgi:HK97 family phage major capsid protein